MTMQSCVLLVVFLAVLLAMAYPLGLLLARVGSAGTVNSDGAIDCAGSRGKLPGLGWLHRIEQLLYRALGPAAGQGQSWKAYALSLLAFNTLGVLV
ncbi:MAG: potassium-transporting ATPase subunit KdpA, partial [Janthinobacterium lividum]